MVRKCEMCIIFSLCQCLPAHHLLLVHHNSSSNSSDTKCSSAPVCFVLLLLAVGQHLRITESQMFWVGRDDHKGHLVQLTCDEQGHLQLDQFAQSIVQPDFECFKGQNFHHLSGRSVPVPHSFIVKGFFHICNLNLPSCCYFCCTCQQQVQYFCHFPFILYSTKNSYVHASF